MSVETLFERLRADHPRATLELERGIDGGRYAWTMTCKETSHRVSCESEEKTEGRVEEMRAHLGGKKFAKAAEEAERMESLRQYEPYIVASAHVKGQMFCRLTGSRLRATEDALVKHASGKRFEKAHAKALAEKTPLLEEKDPETVEREKAAARAEQKKREEKNKATRTAMAEDRKATQEKNREERRRLRENGGFDESMGCWVPPGREIDSEDDEDDEDDEDKDDDDGSESTDDDGPDNDLEDDFYEDYDSSDDDDEADLIPNVVAPGAAKRARLAERDE